MWSYAVLSVGFKAWGRVERAGAWMVLALIWSFYAVVLYLQLLEISWCRVHICLELLLR